MKQLFWGLFLLSLLSSCSTFRETHYFKDTLAPTANYYKVEVRGSTLMSSSRYVSGYYDRGAVQAYFGEINQPAKGRFPVPLAEGKGLDTGTKVDDKKEKELVLLLSTNSDAIANSISNLVKSKTVVQSLSILANKDKLQQSDLIQLERAASKTEIELFIAKVDAYLDIDVSGSFDARQIRGRLKNFVKSELSERTTKSLPDTFDELNEVYFSLNP